ncbi:MAG TPA: PspC domain-containing protein [Gaiellaceae bacterium]
MPLPRFERDPGAGVLAGVCAGIARSLGVDPTLVRLIFALLALAGGAGILLYLGLWAYSADRSPWLFGGLGVLAVSGVLHSLGISDRVVLGIALVVGGLVLVWRRGGFRSDDATRSIAGTTLAAAGAVLVLSNGGVHAAALTPGAVGGSLLLVAGPWLWRLAHERDAERAARIRSEERADLAARVHDSVLQTLALIQRHADDPHKTAAFARRQERELRSWLYGDRGLAEESLTTLLAAAAADVEELHDVRVELASSGDAPADDAVRSLVLAAREAMTNSAKHSGAEEIDVYADATDELVSVFVRDRGAGFDPSAVPADRRGIANSIVRRLERAGGAAKVTSTPGEGTEVELSVPRSAP